MAAIRALAAIAEKWSRVTSQRGQDYADGVASPRAPWAESTAAANASYKSGIQASVAADSFLKGVQKAGNARWQKGVTQKGVQRFGPGVTVAQDDYARAFAPFREAIARVTLPPRGPRRDPRNLERVRLVNDALVKAKLGGA